MTEVRMEVITKQGNKHVSELNIGEVTQVDGTKSTAGTIKLLCKEDVRTYE